MGTLTLKRAGPSLLEMIADDLLAKHDSALAALPEFIDEIRDAGGLMVDLIDAESTASFALAFLQRRAAGQRRSSGTT